MSAPADWIEHRRGDRELIGWIRMVGDVFVAVDLLGRDVSGPLDWVAAEEALEAHGLAFLADRWELVTETGPRRVRIAEVSTAGIRVREDDFGAASAVGADVREHVLPWPAPEALRHVG